MKATFLIPSPCRSSLRAWAVVAVLVPALGAATASAAATGAGKNRKRPAAAAAERAATESHGTVDALKIFDKNGNERIDADELAAVQSSFGALKKLDANGNGEIEQSELDHLNAAAAHPSARPGADGHRGRALAGLREVDKNGNHQVDPEEVGDLEKMLAGGRIMERLDQNGNGKLEPDEVKHLNERIGKGFSGARPGKPAEPSVRRAPEKSITVPAPIVPPKPEDEKPGATSAPATEAKPEAAPSPATSGSGPKPPGGFGT